MLSPLYLICWHCYLTFRSVLCIWRLLYWERTFCLLLHALMQGRVGWRWFICDLVLNEVRGFSSLSPVSQDLSEHGSCPRRRWKYLSWGSWRSRGGGRSKERIWILKADSRSPGGVPLKSQDFFLRALLNRTVPSEAFHLTAWVTVGFESVLKGSWCVYCMWDVTQRR